MTGAQRREQLLGVARTVFAERGYEAATVEEIAERAGVTRPVVYEHFGGKEGIYAVVVDREVQRLSRAIRAALASSGPRKVAEASAAAFLTYIEQDAEGFRVLVRDAPGGSGRGSFGSLLDDVAEAASDVVRELFAEHGLDPAPAPIYARMLVGAVAAIGEWWLEQGEAPKEVVTAHVLNLLWNGLRDLEPW